MLEERVFGENGARVVVEEYLHGEEATVLALCDGADVVPLISSQDHKPALDGDQGPNTGGMGAIAPAPVVTPRVMGRVIDRILLPLVDLLREEGVEYRGVIYAGLMISEEEPKVVEFNCRFGDPEAEAVLPLLESDLAEALHRAATGSLRGMTLQWKRAWACDVVMASGGYPGAYRKGMEISGLDGAEEEDLVVYHAGTRREQGRVLTDGGRVLNVVGIGHTLRAAVDRAYRGVSRISFQGAHYRRDIGWRGLARVK
ncbi:MAG: phosphoribosylamine--glycine ligase, partial [Spirochaetota bacterium]